MFAKSGVRRNASHGRSSRWSRLLLLAIATVMGIVLLAGVVLAAAVTIDTFNEATQSLEVQPTIPTDSDYANDAGILGGQRDALLEYSSGSGARIYLDIDFGGTSNRLAYTAGDTMKGKATLQWDGQDNNAIALDDDGLCNPDCVDLTDGGTNDGFHVQVIFDDLKCNLTFKVYTGTNWSQYTVNLPGGISEESNRVDAFFPFNGFTVGGGTGAVFTSTGAVVMEVDGTVVSGADVTIDMMATDSNREYGDLPVVTYTTSILNANHIPKGLRLGNNCDVESTYNSSIGADGDDTNDFDDEDGVEPTSVPWSAGSNGGKVNVTREGCAAAGTCYVNGWIDWNNDGDFDDLNVDGASEHIVNNVSRNTDATEQHTFNTPTSYSAGSYYARFRICQGSTDCDDPDTTDTNVTNGEVEDYKWDTTPTAVTLTRLDVTSVPPRSPVGAVAAMLAVLTGSVAIGGVLMRRRRVL
jgi:hypothetical protein